MDAQGALSSQIPVIPTIAMVIPEVAITLADTEPVTTPFESADADARRRIELIAMETVMAAERVAGNTPVDVSADNRGYDIESTLPGGSLRFLEVKGRISTADEVTVTHNEMRRGFNEPERFVLAIVLVDPAEQSGKGGGAVQGPFYIRKPFDRAPGWTETKVTHSVSKILTLAE